MSKLSAFVPKFCTTLLFSPVLSCVNEETISVLCNSVNGDQQRPWRRQRGTGSWQPGLGWKYVKWLTGCWLGSRGGLLPTWPPSREIQGQRPRASQRSVSPSGIIAGHSCAKLLIAETKTNIWAPLQIKKKKQVKREKNFDQTQAGRFNL